MTAVLTLEVSSVQDAVILVHNVMLDVGALYSATVQCHRYSFLFCAC